MNVKKIIVSDEDEVVEIEVKDKSNCVDVILEEYKKYDICMEDFLYSTELQGFSIQDVVDIFAKVINIVDLDQVLIYNDSSSIPVDRSQW